MNEGWNVILRYDEDFDGLNMWLVKQEGTTRIVVHPIDLTLTSTVEPYTIMPEPTMRFHGAESGQILQGLADALVVAGYRPNELKAKDSELVAVRYHLEDMRKLVMEALLPPELPPPRV